MTKQFVFLGFMMLLLLHSSSARAEAIPEYALDKDYQNCMGGDTAEKEPERAQYCNCIRDSMRSWDLDTYGAVAMEQSKSSNAQKTPQKIEDLARACIAKVLK